MFLPLSCSCLCLIYWSQVWSREWRCRWSSADRRYSNYIWVFNKFMAYWGASYIRYLTVVLCYAANEAIMNSIGKESYQNKVLQECAKIIMYTLYESDWRECSGDHFPNTQCPKQKPWVVSSRFLWCSSPHDFQFKNDTPVWIFSS